MSVIILIGKNGLDLKKIKGKKELILTTKLLTDKPQNFKVLINQRQNKWMESNFQDI